jgi:hypothetical protein
MEVGAKEPRQPPHHRTTMTPVTETLLCQLVHQRTANAAARILSAMTGCQIITDDAGMLLYFKRQSGPNRITHLKVAYNEATDLYDLQGFRYNRRTLECPEVLSQPGVYAEDLKRTCENTTGLAFSL